MGDPQGTQVHPCTSTGPRRPTLTGAAVRLGAVIVE